MIGQQQLTLAQAGERLLVAREALREASGRLTVCACAGNDRDHPAWRFKKIADEQGKQVDTLREAVNDEMWKR